MFNLNCIFNSGNFLPTRARISGWHTLCRRERNRGHAHGRRNSHTPVTARATFYAAHLPKPHCTRVHHPNVKQGGIHSSDARSPANLRPAFDAVRHIHTRRGDYEKPRKKRPIGTGAQDPA